MDEKQPDHSDATVKFCAMQPEKCKFIFHAFRFFRTVSVAGVF